MCTVTFIPTGNSGFVLTSNRDEAPNRETSLPDFHTIDNTKMLFPKDTLAGGTWIGVSEKQRMACLLNGGFTIHERKANYRMSRGVIVKDALATNDVVKTLNDYDLCDIEPFTLIVVEWDAGLQLFELVWDGKQKHLSSLPIASRLWSSSSLYNESMKMERQNWFSDFLNYDDLSSDSLLEFHRTAGNGNLDFGVVMDRGFVKTTSMTQIKRSEKGIIMYYHDLVNDEQSQTNFDISQVVNEK
ncbi:MAG: NRDE family protein [Bacteroidia bacterium]|nr:NRDE family protein [Bacteroidia bacterium]NND10991.1 hypothetical protein [Flavobacteriaceae bacterium]MBT8311008.1 NRDE family protein [Bacteroidia bacterium]NNK27875.1 hypothetical protein [Flavobacteriaceae bacterium]NNL61623.1 hypothetical protein [Flavobacteriaceae bacterium]